MISTRPRLLAVGAVSAAFAASCIASLSTGSGDGGPLRPAPAAAATGLTPFDDCTDVRDWYVRQALPHVTAWGLDGPVDVLEGASFQSDDGVRRTSLDAVGSSDTGTNVQEAGVDEPDIAKTDGHLVITLGGDNLVVTDVSGSEPVEVGRVGVPRAWSAELLLVGDRAVVTSTATPYGPTFDGFRYAGPRNATVTTVDLSDPSAPTVEDVRRVDGSILTSRAHDGTVRIAVTSQPKLDFVYPTRKRSAAQAREKNREIVRGSTADAWIPHERVNGKNTALVECSQISHPDRGAGIGAITVMTMDPDDPAEAESTAVSADGSLVYASADRFYVATTDGGWSWIRRGHDDGPTTAVHAFATDGATTEYVASGSVSGYVPDRWAFSEHDGVLRVAAEQGNGWNPKQSKVFAIEENGASLDVVGSVGGIGKGEQIKAVRWFGDIGVVVTFRQTDPVYTLDLSDPTRPRILGELKIRGYSSYLHPVGGDLLLGVGQRATARGRERGLQMSVFDLADLTDPTRVAKLSLGKRWGYSPVEYDSRAFTYLPQQRLALIPAWGGGDGNRIEVVRIGRSGALEHVRTISTGGRAEQSRTLPLDDGRVAVVSGGQVVRLVGVVSDRRPRSRSRG
ncbi:MAG: beta-propeller domain-containing protein [Actinomycetia bacterium]|nr:beta-propeller domain-containing protein [Actinomycetes bacterium]